MSALQQAEAVGVYGDASGGVIVTIQWEGIDKFSRFLHETPGVVLKDVEAALFQEGENIMGVSVKDTPVDLGPLAASAHVKPPITRRNTIVTLAYGTDYAVFVHEILTAKHTVGKAKFLEGAMKDAARGFGGRLKKRVLDRIGRRL